MIEDNMLDKLRGQMDNTDNEIMILLKRRIQTSRKIAQYKLKNNLEIYQRERENQVINEKISKAINMDLDKEFVLDLFERIILESKKEQQKVMDKK